ncbi:MAG: hypothetical protein HY319_12100 [Armatimonadetes bacterium]|nr:hypothetical protein [Armatimonadota bacterium]
MSKYDKHLYAVMYPNHALIASQLVAEDFGRYYSVGTARYYTGKMIFIEVDIGFRNDYFEIDKYLELTVEHEDGSPKMTKFISSYRVLEHLALDAMGPLYAATPNGETLRIEPAEYDASRDAERIKIIQELNPIELLVATTFDHRAFGAYLTEPGNPKGSPRLFYTQIELNVEAFLKMWQENPFMAPPLPGVHPQKLQATLDELGSDPQPRTKSIGIQSVFDKMSYRNIRNGFFVVGEGKLKHYPLPSESELRRNHYDWWKSMD